MNHSGKRMPRSRYQRLSVGLRSVLATVPLLLAVAGSAAGDSGPRHLVGNGTVLEKVQQRKDDHVPGALVVKLREGLLLSDLAALNARHKVSSSSRVFPEAASLAERLDGMRARLATLMSELAAGTIGPAGFEEGERLRRRLASFERRLARAPRQMSLPSLDRVFLLRISPTADVAAVAQEYARHPGVEYAEPDYSVGVVMVPNDPRFYEQWAHQNIRSETAWDITTGSAEVVVAVIDTGVDYEHPDLAANLWTNSLETPGNGLDDDGNGYVDDVLGWDFNADAADPRDDHGHGTHCAGIAAASGDNGTGTAGVCFSARIMALKFLNSSGYGSTSTGAAAIRYAADNGADILSMSWGSSAFSQVEKDAADYAYAQGCLLVAAAGNNNSSTIFYPAGHANVQAVAATDSTDARASFSNYGSWIDIAAPGTAILSTMPGYAVTLNTGSGLPLEYAVLSGTSMACPHVAGLAALILGRQPALSNEGLWQVIRDSADDLGSPGWDAQFGWGRINAAAAMGNAPPLVARIANILAGQDVRAPLALVGSAFGPAFSSWLLETGRGLAPQGWEAVCDSSSPVENGALCTFDPAPCFDEEYALRLTVFGNGGERYEYRTWITIDNVYLSGPANGALVAGGVGNKVTVQGGIHGTGLASYTVEHGEGENPSVWSTESVVLSVADVTAGADGALADWDLAKVPATGYYTIRLTAHYLSRQDETASVTVWVDKDVHPGWPKDIRENAGDKVYSSPVSADFDGDGQQEIFAISWWGTAYLWDADGSVMPGWPKDLPGGVTSTPAVADLDADGDLEIVLTSSAGYAAVWAWHHDGISLSGWPKPFADPASSFPGSAALGDVDGDGNLEIVAAVYSVYGTQAQMFVWNVAGTLLPGWPFSVTRTKPRLYKGEVALADFNGDGADEIVVAVNDASVDPGTCTVYVLDGFGRSLPGWPQTRTHGWGGDPSVGDVNKDGRLEIFLNHFDGILAFDDQGNDLPGWNTAYVTTNRITLADLDGDWDLEVMYEAEAIYARHHDGANVAGWPRWVTNVLVIGRPFYPSAVVGDVSGDGRIDVVLPLGGGLTQIEGREANGWTAAGFPRRLGGDGVQGVGATASLDDLDGDGKVELLGAGLDGRVYLWDLGVPFSAAPTDWRRFGHDLRLTRFCPPREDATPPSTPAVADEGGTTTSTTQLSASWSAADRESGVVEYQYAVGTAPGALDIRSWTSTGSAASVAATGLALSLGRTYYFSVKARNLSGLWGAVGYSDGILVTDATPPTTPVVADEGATTVPTNTLRAWWSASDPETGVAEFQYAIGTSRRATNVRGWTSAGTAVSVTATGLKLSPGKVYYFSVKAKNGTGGWSETGQSDGIAIKRN